MIARLKKERDEARTLLSEAERKIPLLSASEASAPVTNGKRCILENRFVDGFMIPGDRKKVVPYLSSPFFACRAAVEDYDVGPDGKRIRPGITNDIIEELSSCNTLLSAQRKKRQVTFFFL